MRFGDLLKAVGAEDEREELARLGREYAEARRLTREGGEPQGEARREAALDALLDKVRWSLRAARHPLPTRQQLEEMLTEPFE